MPFTNVFPRWENPGANPPEVKKDVGEGWAAEDRPPADWFNWYWSEVYLAGGETQDLLEDHSARHEEGGADEINLEDLSGESAAHKAHLLEEMPHQFVDGGTTYKYGFKGESGHLVFMYEEVV